MFDASDYIMYTMLGTSVVLGGVYTYKKHIRRAIATSILWCLGWTDVSCAHPLPKSFIGLGEPHTHILDAVFACMFMWSWDMSPCFLVNQKFFRFGLGHVLRAVGACPVDTMSSTNVVSQLVKRFEQSNTFVMQIAPSGTRKYTDHWRSGFMHIAQQANVPIVPIFLHYTTKEFGYSVPIVAHDRDISAVMDDIRDAYRDKRGLVPTNESKIVLKCEPCYSKDA